MSTGQRIGEGTREVSWIWLDPQALKSAVCDATRVEGKHEMLCYLVLQSIIAMKIKWLKSRARVQRWTEEVNLLPEEMRRVLLSLEFHSAWWSGLQSGWEGVDDCLLNGIRAYALRQADTLNKIHAHFVRLWGTRSTVDINDVDNVDDGDTAELHETDACMDRTVDLD